MEDLSNIAIVFVITAFFVYFYDVDFIPIHPSI